jgi:hypothetical protein
MRTTLLAVAAVALSGCGAATAARPATDAPRYEAHGVSVVLPAGWTHATRSLTPGLFDPREVMSVATYPLEYRRIGCNHMPSSALADIGPRDAFVTLMERGRGNEWKSFPPRPAHFSAALGGRSEAIDCVPGAHFTDHWFGFSDGGRHFHVLVAFGPDAPAAVRDEAWAVLDGLRVDPSVQPDWDSTG